MRRRRLRCHCCCGCSSNGVHPARQADYAPCCDSCVPEASQRGSVCSGAGVCCALAVAQRRVPETNSAVLWCCIVMYCGSPNAAEYETVARHRAQVSAPASNAGCCCQQGLQERLQLCTCLRCRPVTCAPKPAPGASGFRTASRSGFEIRFG